MLRFSKKADYGLIALRHLACHPGETCTAKEIAEAYLIPAELMAKILQRLVQDGLVASQQGSNGGYVLARKPEEIRAVDVIEALEGPFSITSCRTDRGLCFQFEKCTVKDPLAELNLSVVRLLERMTIRELAGTESFTNN